MNRVDNRLIEACRIQFLKGSTIEACSKQYGLKTSTVHRYCRIQGWAKSKAIIEGKLRDCANGIDNQVVTRMVEKASSFAADKLQERIQTHIEEMLKGSADLRSKLLTNLTEKTVLPPTLKMDEFESGVRTLQRLDGIARLSMNLPSTVEQHNVTGTIDINAKVLGIISSVRNQDIPLELPDDKSLDALAKRLADESKT